MYCHNSDCPDLEQIDEPGEYRPEVTHCPTCGEPLSPGLPEWAQLEASESHGRMVPVLPIYDPAQVPVVQSLLAGAGIAFVIRNEFVQDILGWGRLGSGYNPLTGPPEILVDEEKVEEARVLLDEFIRANQTGE